MLNLWMLLMTPAPAVFPPGSPALIRQDDQERHGRHDGEDEDGDEGHDRDHGRREQAWKREHRDEENTWRQWAKHHEDGERDEDRGWDFDHPRHAHLPPPWMNPWWGARRGPRYVAVVPNDPTRCYVLIDGRWILRRVRDIGFQADLDDVMRFPAAPPPIPLPHVHFNLHVVLFN